MEKRDTIIIKTSGSRHLLYEEWLYTEDQYDGPSYWYFSKIELETKDR